MRGTQKIGCGFKYSLSLCPPGSRSVDLQNLVKINLAVAALRMREETRFRVFFCLHIRLSVLHHAYSQHF